MLQELKQACAGHDAAQVRRALGRWLREFGPASPSGSLLAFAAESGSPELRRCLMSLDAAGFRPDQNEAWDGSGLWSAFTTWRQQWVKRCDDKSGDVTDLYAV